jgi:hypothetical protein
VFLYQRNQSISIKNSHLTLCRDITASYGENHTKHNVACLLKAIILKTAQTAVVRERLFKRACS